MRKHVFGVLLVLAMVGLATEKAVTQEEKKKDGPPPGGPCLIPPFVRDQMKLTDDQQQRVGTLGSSIQLRLAKILTDKQMQQLDAIMKQGPGGNGGKGQIPKGPKRAPGLVIPPFAEGRLQLTQKQQQQIAVLERYAMTELFKILTPAQQRQFAEALRRGPGDKPGGAGRAPEPAPPPSPAAQNDASSAGIQWFATWSSGLQEAERSGRPILLVAAAPHCAGVSGTW